MMAYVGAVMTLPGIAGFILTIGIGVDSNVLIFERIKEELEARQGRASAAINAGFSRVFLTLVDTHMAGFIAAAFLFQFGTGPIRGFAVTLTFGLISNLFTSTSFPRRCSSWSSSGTPAGADAFHLAMHIFKNTNFNFLRWRWQAMGLSWLVIAGRASFVILTRGHPARRRVLRRHEPRSSRFSSPVSVEDQIRGARCRRSPRESCRSTASPGRDQMLIRAAADGEERAGREPVGRRTAESQQMLKAGRPPGFKIEGTEIVGPTVGAELRRQAIYATLLSMLGITASGSRPLPRQLCARLDRRDVPRRARHAGVSGVLPVRDVAQRHRGDADDGRLLDERHDRHLRSRAREHARCMRREPLESAINTSLNQTLTRTIITVGHGAAWRCSRCFSSAGKCCSGFAFTMLVGTIATHLFRLVHRAIARDLAQQEAARRLRRRRRPPSAADIRSRPQVEIAAKARAS